MTAPATKAKPQARARRSQKERTETAHRRMIRAATKLISRRGYTKTTLAEVGREAGYTGGLVSHHFGSKQGLLDALVHHLAQRFLQDQITPAVEGLPGLERLEAYVDTYVDELDLRPGRMKALYVLMGEALGPVPEIRDVFARVTEGMRRNVIEWTELGIEDGSIRPDASPEATALLIVSMLRGISNQRMLEPAAVDIDLARQSLQAALRQNLEPRATQAKGSRRKNGGSEH